MTMMTTITRTITITKTKKKKEKEKDSGSSNSSTKKERKVILLAVTADKDTFNWITLIVSLASVSAGILTTLLAKVFKSGKKEAGFEGQGKLFENMLTNVVKEQIALKDEFKELCVKVTDTQKDTCAKLQDLNLRLTKSETRQQFEDRQDSYKERDRYRNRDRRQDSNDNNDNNISGRR
jgi:hypothetical protein